MTPRTNFESKFISPEMSSFLMELSILLDKHGVSLSFEAETESGQGAMLTIQRGEEITSIEVESPDAFDLDGDMFKCLFRDLMIMPN